jgi:hypothetical protein
MPRAAADGDGRIDVAGLGPAHLSMLKVTPELSVPGGEVAVSGFSYTRPVSIHFRTVDGPVLGTFTPDSNSDLRGAVTIPADTKPGSYLLFATQDDAGKPTRLPARASLTVAPAGGAPVLAGVVSPEPRVPAVLRKDDDVSSGSLVLAGLAGAGVALLGVGSALVARSRRRS